jgi:hypothetical protein
MLKQFDFSRPNGTGGIEIDTKANDRFSHDSSCWQLELILDLLLADKVYCKPNLVPATALGPSTQRKILQP